MQSAGGAAADGCFGYPGGTTGPLVYLGCFLYPGGTTGSLVYSGAFHGIDCGGVYGRAEAATTEEVEPVAVAAAEVVALGTLPVGQLHSCSTATTSGSGSVVISIAECADGFVLSDSQCVLQTRRLL